MNHKLHTFQAILFTPDTGNLAGHTFLVVDADGLNGDTPAADYAFDITGVRGLANFGLEDFI